MEESISNSYSCHSDKFTFLLFVLVSLLFLFTSSPSLATVPAVTDGDSSIPLPVTNSNSFVLEQIIIIGILIH